MLLQKYLIPRWAIDMFHTQSRLNLATVIAETNRFNGTLSKPAYVGIRKRITDFAPDDRLIMVDGSFQWSHYGLELLQDARNWWVIADLSGVIDPFSELTFGSTVRAPSIQRFLFDIVERPPT